MELKELDKKLEQKEAEMKRFASVDTSVLKQHYEKKVHELEQEKKSLQKEIEELRCNLSNISSTSDDGAQKLKEEYLQKLNVLESQVLQRETEEASMATKRLKELLECRKASSRETFGAGNGNGPRIQALEHELEVTVLVHEVRAEYERQLEERARMAKEVARLKEEADLLRQSRLSDCLETMSPSATSSSSLVSMASLLSEAEERERGFSGRGRWNQIRSLADAINILNYLFNLASSSR
uniref:Uncharacterized protein n=1 Tax=Fagus sylvatica TaxID=28930 RepID=A0A2N9I4F8_FAGSY